MFHIMFFFLRNVVYYPIFDANEIIKYYDILFYYNQSWSHVCLDWNSNVGNIMLMWMQT